MEERKMLEKVEGHVWRRLFSSWQWHLWGQPQASVFPRIFLSFSVLFFLKGNYSHKGVFLREQREKDCDERCFQLRTQLLSWAFTSKMFLCFSLFYKNEGKGRVILGLQRGRRSFNTSSSLLSDVDLGEEDGLMASPTFTSLLFYGARGIQNLCQ